VSTECCAYCGAEDWQTVDDVFPDLREVSLLFCCEGQRDDWSEYMRLFGSDRPVRREQQMLLADVGVSARRLTSEFLIDFGLDVRPIDWRTAKAFVEQHHRHNPYIRGWRFGFAVYNGNDLVGVCTVGRPVARALDASTTVEVTRVCVRADLPEGLTWGACSALYVAAAAEAEARGFQRIITYTLESENGSALKGLSGSGWRQAYKTRPNKTWNCASRPRAQKSPTCAKWCWEKLMNVGEERQAA
jgi:hypothetical protein